MTTPPLSSAQVTAETGPEAVWYQATLQGEPDVSSPAVFAVRAFTVDEVEGMLLDYLEQPGGNAIYDAPKVSMQEFSDGKRDSEPTYRTNGDLLGVKAIEGCLAGENAIVPVTSSVAARWGQTVRENESVFFFASRIVDDWLTTEGTVSTKPL